MQTFLTRTVQMCSHLILINDVEKKKKNLLLLLLVSTGNQWKWRRSLMRLLYKNKRELIQSGWAEIGYDWCVPSQGRGHWFKAWTLTYSNDLKCIFNITGAHRVYSTLPWSHRRFTTDQIRRGEAAVCESPAMINRQQLSAFRETGSREAYELSTRQ